MSRLTPENLKKLQIVYPALKRNLYFLDRLGYEDMYPHLVGRVSLYTLEEDVAMWHYLTGWHLSGG